MKARKTKGLSSKQQGDMGKLQGWGYEENDITQQTNLLRELQKKITLPALDKFHQKSKSRPIKKPIKNQKQKNRYSQWQRNKNLLQKHQGEQIKHIESEIKQYFKQADDLKYVYKAQSKQIEKLPQKKQKEQTVRTKKINQDPRLLLNSKTEKQIRKAENIWLDKHKRTPSSTMIIRKNHVVFKTTENQREDSMASNYSKNKKFINLHDQREYFHKNIWKKLNFSANNCTIPKLYIQNKFPDNTLTFQKQQKKQQNSTENNSHKIVKPLIDRNQSKSLTKMIWIDRFLNCNKLKTKIVIENDRKQSYDFVDEHLQTRY